MDVTKAKLPIRLYITTLLFHQCRKTLPGSLQDDPDLSNVEKVAVVIVGEKTNSGSITGYRESLRSK